VKAADYLKARGWWRTSDSCGDDGDGELEWLDPAFESIYPLARAVTIQQARDAAEERRCVADAIANAASRFAKLDCDIAMVNVMQAATTAQTAWLRMYGVEVEL
jgi:hypothetical protein